MTSMLKRTIVGSVLIVLVGCLFWLDWWLEQSSMPALSFGAGGVSIVLRGLPLAVLVMLLVSAGYLELSRLSAGVGVSISRFSGMVCAIMVGTLPFWRQTLSGGGPASLPYVVLAAALLILFADQIIHHGTDGAIRRVGVGLLAICYLGVCGAVILDIRMQFGVHAFVLFLLVVKATDIGAYFTGSAIGRHKMSPRLSPGKSWEGLIGGLIFAAVVAIGFVSVMEQWGSGWRIGFAAAACFAVVVGLFGQVADLCESTLKRDAGLKDAGTSAGPFGGILDMLDSPLLSAPVAYIILSLL